MSGLRGDLGEASGESCDGLLGVGRELIKVAIPFLKLWRIKQRTWSYRLGSGWCCPSSMREWTWTAKILVTSDKFMVSAVNEGRERQEEIKGGSESCTHPLVVGSKMIGKPTPKRRMKTVRSRG